MYIFSQRLRITPKINHWIITLQHFFYQRNIGGFPLNFRQLHVYIIPIRQNMDNKDNGDTDTENVKHIKGLELIF